MLGAVRVISSFAYIYFISSSSLWPSSSSRKRLDDVIGSLFTSFSLTGSVRIFALRFSTAAAMGKSDLRFANRSQRFASR